MGHTHTQTHTHNKVAFLHRSPPNQPKKGEIGNSVIVPGSDLNQTRDAEGRIFALPCVLCFFSLFFFACSPKCTPLGAFFKNTRHFSSRGKGKQRAAFCSRTVYVPSLPLGLLCGSIFGPCRANPQHEFLDVELKLLLGVAAVALLQPRLPTRTSANTEQRNRMLRGWAVLRERSAQIWIRQCAPPFMGPFRIHPSSCS